MLAPGGFRKVDFCGCLIGNYLIRSERDEAITVLERGWDIAAYINVYGLPARGHESDELMLLATYMLPNYGWSFYVKQPRANVTFLGGGESGFPALLRIEMGTIHFWAPTRAFIPDGRTSVRSSPVLWKDWGPTYLCPASFGMLHLQTMIATAGLRIIYPDVSLNFNQLDIAHNIYAPRDGEVEGVFNEDATGKGLLWRTNVSSDVLRQMGLPPTSGQMYRSLWRPITGQSWSPGTIAQIIEEQDGPKVCGFRECNIPRRSC